MNTLNPTRKSLRAAERREAKLEKRAVLFKKITGTSAALAVGAGMGLTAILPAAAAEEDRATWDSAVEVLQTIEVRDSDEVDTEYVRGDWGGWLHWSDSGCDTQQDVLIRDTVPDSQVLSVADDCVLIYGTSEDPYSGDHVVHDRDDEEFNRTPFDIDHVVSLSDAHHSGGHEWNNDEKREFSQDQENLVASLASVNREKSDSTLDEWLPPQQDRYYDYVSSVIYVKDKYDLSMTQAEYDVAEDILSDEGYEDTLASPAITMTYNYQQAQDDEPTEEPSDEETPTDEPTETPTDEPTEEPTDEPTEEETEEPTDSTPTDEPTDGGPDDGDYDGVTFPEDEESDTTDDQVSPETTNAPGNAATDENRPAVIPEDDNGSGYDGVTFPDDDATLEEDDDIIIDENDDNNFGGGVEDGNVEDDSYDGVDMFDNGNNADGEANSGDGSVDGEETAEFDADETERLADAGPGETIGWMTAAGLAAVGFGAFMVMRGRVASRKH